LHKTTKQTSDQLMAYKDFEIWLNTLRKEMTPLTDDFLVKQLLDIEFFSHAQVKHKLLEFTISFKNKDVNKLREAAKQVFIVINEIFGDKNLSPIFERVAKYESSLFSLLPFYRDHIIHSIRVFMTGLYLLKLINEKCLHTYKLFFKSEELTFSTFLKWLLLSTCHDIAIPIEKFGEINNVLMNFYGQFPGFSFEKAKLSPVQSWLVSLPEFLAAISPDVKVQAKLTKNLNNNEHGVLGAITLLYLSIQGILELPKVPRDYYELYIEQYIVPIARGIALHNTDEIVNFEADPLTFLLILCDEIQEWGRFLSIGKTFFKSIYETWINVKEENKKLIIDVLNFSSGKDHARISELNPEYDPTRLIEEKKKNLLRLYSENLGGDFFIARTATYKKSAHPDFKRNYKIRISYGNKRLSETT